MMEQYSGDFLAAVDGLRARSGARGSVAVSVARLGLRRVRRWSGERGEVEANAGTAAATRSPLCSSRRRPSIRRRRAIGGFDAVIMAGQLLHQHHAALARARRQGALAGMKGDRQSIANLLTEGAACRFTAGEAARWVRRAPIGRPVEVVIANTSWRPTTRWPATPPSTGTARVG